jgi:asparagine synthase (glutamine-hydrolysing)
LNDAEDNSDKTKRLLEGYRCYGKKLLDKLQGSFSFVLYDFRNKQLFGARDPLGIATLYYTETADGYCFASDIGELLSLPSVIKKPNLRSMRTMMQCFAVDYHDTMYEGIYRLPPGHSITIENGEKQIERYWFPEKIEIDYGIDEQAAAEKLKELLGQAVDRLTSAPQETAFELSGGLDSSSVVSLLAQKRDPGKIDSYSMDFGSLACDEGVYVDAVLAKYPVNHQKVPVGGLDYHKQYALASLYALSPHWPIGLTFAMLLPMLEKMKEDGKKVVVSGQGGDHLFTGTPFMLYDLFARGKLSDAFDELGTYRHRWRAFKSYVLAPLLGQKNVRRLKMLLGKKKKYFWDDCNIVDFTEEAGITNPAFKDALDMVTSAYHSTVMDGNIFHSAERHFGIEYRHPFFDRELVEFALSLPPEMKYANRTVKRILRKAMEGILPEKINRRRDKAEFSELLSQQMKALDLEALLGEPYIVKLGLIDQSDIERCIEKYRSGDLIYVSRLWIIINVEYWYIYNQFEIDEARRKEGV